MRLWPSSAPSAQHLHTQKAVQHAIVPLKAPGLVGAEALQLRLRKLSHAAAGPSNAPLNDPAAGPAPTTQHADALEEVPTVEAVPVDSELEQVAAETLEDYGYVEPSEQDNRTASFLYGGMGLLHCVLGGAMAVAALQAPQLLLPASAVDGLSSALLMVLAASWLRTGSMLLHLKGMADAQELIAWRVQRPSIVLVAVSALSVLLQAFGIASPQLAAVSTVLAIATAAVCAKVSLSTLQTSRPVHFAYVEGDPWATLSNMWQFKQRDMQSLASVLSLAVVGLSLYGFISILISPQGPISHMPAALAAASPSYTDTAAALRRAVGLGMAGMALTAHVVLDAAAEARVHGMHQAVQLEVYERMLLKDSPIGRFVVQLPTQYTTLNLGIVLSALMQGAAVLLASSHGVNVNWDGALWGPLYGTAFLSLVYGIAAARSYDWGSLCRDLIGMLGAVVGVLAGAFNTLVFKQEWLFAGRR